MSLVNLIKSALMNIRARKVRVFLTMFGIIIGISSVVTIVSVGDGLKAHISSIISDASTDQYTIAFTPENSMEEQGVVEYFNEQDMNEIKKIQGVTSVSKASSALGGMFSFYEVSYFGKSTYIDIASNQDVQMEVSEGRWFQGTDGERNEIVLYSEAAKELFGDSETAIGCGITLNGEQYEVIGVTDQMGGGILGIDYSYLSETNLKALDTNDNISSINFTITPGLDVNEIFQEINETLTLNHAEAEGEYELQDPQEVTKAFEAIIGNLTIFIACISAISLFVGGVGVMNIMYVSVSERKREIGIRRAIGAKSGTILCQFLFEAMIITLLGGFLGITVGCSIAKILDFFLPFTTVISGGNVLASTVISVIVGLVFGIVPARNAAKMQPIEAIYR